MNISIANTPFAGNWLCLIFPKKRFCSSSSGTNARVSPAYNLQLEKFLPYIWGKVETGDIFFYRLVFVYDWLLSWFTMNMTALYFDYYAGIKAICNLFPVNVSRHVASNTFCQDIQWWYRSWGCGFMPFPMLLLWHEHKQHQLEFELSLSDLFIIPIALIALMPLTTHC